MERSLDSFFARTPDATLDTCDSEKIHLSGMVQNIAGLLVIDPDTRTIVGASENAGRFLGRETPALLGAALAEIAPWIDDALENVDTGEGIIHEALEVELELDGAAYDVLTHSHAGRRLIEFLPNTQPSAVQARKDMRACSKACTQIMQSESFEEGAQIALDTVRAITGFDRVKLYKFLPDWSGAVFAESRTDRLPSYMGLHFPDTDIPKQAREMMEIVPFRTIGTVSDDCFRILSAKGDAGPVDMTWCMSRSVSAMHTAYLRNIGVQASFSCSLMAEGRLWGLIACHAADAATVSFDTANLIHEISTALTLRSEQQSRKETSDMIADLRRIENQFAAEVRRTGEIEEVVTTLVPILREFFRADGFAFQYGNKIHLSGDTPPEPFIRNLIHWSQSNRDDGDQFQTVALPKVYPEAAPHIDTACGVLIQPIVMHRVCQLIWFRGPISRNVAWAGRPDAKLLTDAATGATLGPRTSFDRWVQEHNDESLPWRAAELEAAREIFQEFLDIIASQLLLKEENANLRNFAHTAAHDIKAPLRGIDLALQWMAEDAENPESQRENHEFAVQSVQKLQKLTESLLEMSLLASETYQFAPANLAQVAREAVSLLKIDIEQSDALVEIDDLPDMLVNESLMLRIFMNLIGNALKYHDPARRPEIRITCLGETDDLIQIAVTDNGQGIAAQHACTIFEPAKRLVNWTEVEGSGFGLAICQRVMEIHGGRIFLDTDHAGGARFVLEMLKTDAAMQYGT